ncbi:hypothetical protein BHM03_00001288 [Ensete ventricosum]|nr:hypothetical protein BHM03_00001288 [Ensete ventricosum]
MHRVDAVGYSPGVRWKLTEGIGVRQDGAREIARRRPRLTGRLSGVIEKLAGNSPKGSGSSLGTRREIAGKKTEGLPAIMPEAVVLCGN